MMAVFFFGAGGAAIITGLAQSYVGLLIGLTLIGLFVSIYHPVGIAWLVKHSEKRGRALGVSGLFGSLGTAAAAIVAGTLAELVSWRAAFILPGIVVMAMGVWFVFYLRAGVIHDHDSVVEDHEPEPSTGEMKRAFVTLLMTVVCVGLIFQGTTVVLPKIFSERLLSGVSRQCYERRISGLARLSLCGWGTDYWWRTCRSVTDQVGVSRRPVVASAGVGRRIFHAYLLVGGFGDSAGVVEYRRTCWSRATRPRPGAAEPSV